MAAPLPEPPPIGLNFFIPWGLLEWAIGGIWSVAAAIAVWVWNLGARVDKTEALMAQLQKDRVNEQLWFQKELDRLQSQNQRLETNLERLKTDILDRVADLPTRVFIESQIRQLTERMDGVIDARMSRRGL